MDELHLQLTPSQVNQVVAAAVGTGSLTTLLSRIANAREVLLRKIDLLDTNRESRTLAVGLLLIASMPSDGSYIKASALSQALEMSPSSTNRYLVTLISLGIAEQDGATRQYRLVP